MMPNRAVRRRWLIWSVCASVSVFGLAGLTLVLQVNPEGTYWVNEVGSIGRAYLKLSNGKATLNVPTGRSNSSPLESYDWGTYKRAGDRWILLGSGGETNLIRTTLWSITLIDPDSVTKHRYFRRLW